MTSGRTKYKCILGSIHNFANKHARFLIGIEYQDISSRYGDMRHSHYQQLAVTGRNQLITWTEKTVGGFFLSYSVSFYARTLRLLTFSGNSLSSKPFSLFFIIMSIVTTETQSVYDWQKNTTFGTPIKNRYNPGYRLVNAVKLSLQSGRNTQLRTFIILSRIL